MRFVILVPWRPIDDRRRWLWDITRPYLEAIGEVFTGDGPGKQWSRAAACNAAATAAGDWDVALVADSDTIPEPGAIDRAVRWVGDTGGAARPHLDRYLLTQPGTMRFAQRGLSGLRPEDIDHSWPGGGLLVLTRAAWEAVGGYSEAYVGWGFEDSQMTMSLLRHSRWDRLPGRAWHLWHRQGRASGANTRLYKQMLVDHAPEIEVWLSNQRGYELGKEAI